MARAEAVAFDAPTLSSRVMVRYERLTLQRSLELDGAVECPFCAQTAFLEQIAGADSQDTAGPTAAQMHSINAPRDSMYEHLARCGYCSYTFCNRCKLPWHGREGCRLNFLYLKYKNGDAQVRESLEASHGRELFEKLAEDERADAMS